jgi:hypothetical protein
MKLEAFRVQNYKKVGDTGWISCRDLTAFVGKNEAGKSAIFRGLSKLNPSDGERYDELKEFPRRRYTDEFKTKDWPVANGRFLLSPEEKTELTSTCSALSECTMVICTRSYSWKLTVAFEPSPDITPVLCKDFAEVLMGLLTKTQDFTAEEGRGDALGQMKSAINDELEPIRRAHEAQRDHVVSKADVDKTIVILANRANEAWQKELLDPLINALKKIAERAHCYEKLAKVDKWVEERLPKFIYFDRYDVIDSAVYLPTFAAQLNQNPPAPKVRTTRCLFEHVGLDIKKLSTLGQHKPGEGANDQIRRLVDERAIHFSSASNAMTQKFSDWWEQRRHKFRYQSDGDYFRVWVSDDLDPSEIELDQRSFGLQYYFSFYLVFLVESAGAHKNCILLLDEPGLHLHGTAQAKLIKFLEKIAMDNQTLYTTHSPFLVDGDHLERARAVYEKEDGTTGVSEDVWPRDKDTLFPLQAALGYQLAQTLFVSKRQLLVEGITDYWLIKTIAEVLHSRNLPTLRPEITLIPAAGVTKLLPLASMLVGHEVEIGALLDGDEPARREGKKLVEKLLAGEDRRCFFIGDFLDGFAKAEIEDVFPEEFYLLAVQVAYPEIKPSFSKEEKQLSGIVKKLESFFKRNEQGNFEKWRVAAVLRDQIMEEPDAVPLTVYKIMSRIFEAANSVFSKAKAEK